MLRLVALPQKTLTPKRSVKMTKKLQIYKCEICGNIVEMVHDGKGQLVCCGQPMKLYAEQTADSSLEKHVPIIEKVDEGVLVKVGSVPHPMEEKHYIEWVELVDEESGKAYRRFLKPGDKPEALFRLCLNSTEHLYAREYCSIHKLWKGE